MKAFIDSLKAYGGQWITAGSAFIGSRLFVGLAALALIVFATQSAIAPNRMAAIGIPPLHALGLAPGVPRPPELLPEVQQQIDSALAAASPYAQEALEGAKTNETLAQFVNFGGALGSLALTILGLYVQNRQARRQSGAAQWWAPQ